MEERYFRNPLIYLFITVYIGCSIYKKSARYLSQSIYIDSITQKSKLHITTNKGECDLNQLNVDPFVKIMTKIKKNRQTRMSATKFMKFS